MKRKPRATPELLVNYALERKCHGELCAFRFHQRDDHLYFADVDDD